MINSLPSRPSETMPMSLLNAALKSRGEGVLQILFLFQVGVGTIANVFLFFLNISPVMAGLPLRPSQLILTHMAMANCLVLFSAGLPHILLVFIPRNPLSHLGCKLVYFIRVLARSMTLCSTCVLSTHQFLTLVPKKLGHGMLRERANHVFGWSCLVCWLFSALNNIYPPMKVGGARDPLNGSDPGSKWFCSTTGPREGMVVLRFIHDAMFISIMVWTSSSMVLLLRRHRQRLRHIHTTLNQYPRGALETRAAHTILVLVVTFVKLYVLNTICAFYYLSIVDTHLWLSHISDILIASFPSVSPFLLILRDPRVPTWCSPTARHRTC